MSIKPLLIFTGGAVLGLSIVTIAASAHGNGSGPAAGTRTFTAEERTEHHEAMEQRFEERLDQAVKDGKITQEQKAQIQAKHKEIEKKMDAEREKLQAMSTEERREYRDEHRQKAQDIREEFRTWAEENDIDLPAQSGGMGHKPGRMHHWR